MIDIEANDTPQSAAARIPLKPDALILLLGAFDPPLAARVRSLCARALAPIALTTNALIVDDGSTEGVAFQMAQAAQQVDQPPAMLGILDPGVNASDANRFLLRMPGAWFDPAKSRMQIIGELAGIGVSTPLPVIALLFGGGDAEKLAMLRCARRGWPVLAVRGAGGLADAILAASALEGDEKTTAVAADPDLGEILSTATLYPVPLDGEVDDIKRLLLGPLRQPTEVLADAWSRYDDFDLAANEKQKQFHSVQSAMLGLAVLATLLAVSTKSLALPHGLRAGLLDSPLGLLMPHLRPTLHVALILVPITISVLSGFNSRFREGNKWVLLRAAAESIKREIFRYRARACAYSEEQCLQTSAQFKLAANIKDISSNLVQSEVNRSSLPHRPIEDVSRLTFLTAEEFLSKRVGDQQGYFVKKTASLYKRLRSLQLWILVAGGLGTFLAAMRFDVWVALTTALATAFTAKLEIDQVETSLVQYNVALTNLSNIRSWWTSLTPWEKTRRKNMDLLVDQTEKTLERETAGWVQQMQSVLDKLTEKQPGAERSTGPASKN